MDFRKFLEMANDSLVEAKKKESTAEKDDKAEKAGKKVAKDIEYDEGHKGKDDKKAEKAGKKVAKDIEYDDKKDKKKKSLKDWFEHIDKQIVAENVPPGMKPMAILDPANKDAGMGVLSSTNPAIQKLLGNLDPKDVKIVMTKTAQPMAGSTQPAQQAKPGQPAQPNQPAQSGLSTGGGAGTAVKEEILDEKAPPGMEDVVLSLKKKYPGEEGRAYAIAWSMYNKKHGKTDEGMTPYNLPQKSQDKTPLERPEKQRERVPFEAAEDNPPSDADGDLLESEKWIQKAIKKPGALKKQLGVPADEKIPAAKLAAAAKKDGKLGQRARLAQTLGKMHEAEIPNSGPDFGAGLGAGRNPDVLESKQVNEAMNTLEAAYHEGKSHGLSKHGYACRYNEGSEEHKRYHDGFKEGLDECYGLMPNRGLVVSEVESESDIVDDMASYGADEGALGEMDKTAYMKQQAIKTPGNTFKAFGQTFSDKEVLETDAFAFESLDKQLNDLLNEGLSVNMSQGLGGPGGQMEDTVSVTAQGDDAGKLLAFIKQVGLGGLGADKPEMIPGEPVVAVASDYGAPKFAGYDNDGASSMMDLIKKVSGGEDYKDEGGADHEHGHDHAHEEKCNECGMMESDCGCEKVEEVQTPDQMTDEMAEDSAGADEVAMTTADEDAEAAEDNTKPAFGGATNEDTGSEAQGGPASGVEAGDDAEEAEAAMKESTFKSLYQKLSMLAEESTSEKDDKAEKAGEKVKKDIEYDDKKDKKEKVDEWANDAGKDGTQQAFERDIEFMTKVISGGLNKPKSTGQQTIPVLAGDKERIGNEDLAEWQKLAGLGN